MAEETKEPATPTFEDKLQLSDPEEERTEEITGETGKSKQPQQLGKQQRRKQRQAESKTVNPVRPPKTDAELNEID